MYRLILIESESKWSFGPIPLLDLKNQIQLDIESRTPSLAVFSHGKGSFTLKTK
jgi:hypothetical protein